MSILQRWKIHFAENLPIGRKGLQKEQKMTGEGEVQKTEIVGNRR